MFTRSLSYKALISSCSLIYGLFFNTNLKADDLINDPDDKVSPYSSEVEFGYQSHTGNSDSKSLNSRIDTLYTSGRHRHSGEFKLHKLDKNGVEDKFQLTLEGQSDYKLGNDIYLYGSFKAIDSRHSAYYKDYTLSGGIGYQLTSLKDLLMEFELGPGYRYQEPNLDELGDDDIIFPNIVKEPILRGQFEANWQVVTSLSLAAKMTMTSGESNSKFDSELSAINNITNDIALKIVHERQYHDKVPNGLSKAESSLSINLLFVF